MVEDKVFILLIEDDEDDYILIDRMLKDIRGNNYDVEWLNNYQEARERIEGDGWDVALVDYDLGYRNGIELIQHAATKGVNSPMIMVTGRGRYELDVEAMKSGAADYLSKDMLNSAVLERVIRYAIEQRRSRNILENLVQERTVELQNALDELRVAEEELRTQHEELLQSNLINADESELHKHTGGEFPSIEVITDAKGMILNANQDALDLLSKKHQSLEGKLLSLFIHLKDHKRFVYLLTRLEELKSPKTEKINLRNMNTELDWCLTLVPLKDQDMNTGKYYWLIHPLYPVQ